MAMAQKRYGEIANQQNDPGGIQNAQSSRRVHGSRQTADDTNDPGLYRNEYRKIKNARLNKKGEVSGNNTLKIFKGPSGVEEKFEEKQSLPARTYNAKKRGGAKQHQDEVTETVPEEEQMLAHAEKSIKTAMKRKLGQKIKKRASLKKVSGFTRWGGLAILCYIYLFQLTFGILSLVGYGVESLAVDFENSSVGQFLSFFWINVADFWPGETIGLAFWALSSIIAVSTFSIYYFWYRITGFDPLKTMASFLVSATCLAMSLLPITNLFPWIILWVVYMNASSLFLRR